MQPIFIAVSYTHLDVYKRQLLDSNFRFSKRIKAVEGTESEALNGVLISKERLSRQMPLELHDNVKIAVIDDVLEAEEIDSGALATDVYKRQVQ